MGSDTDIRSWRVTVLELILPKYLLIVSVFMSSTVTGISLRLFFFYADLYSEEHSSWFRCCKMQILESYEV